MFGDIGELGVSAAGSDGEGFTFVVWKEDKGVSMGRKEGGKGRTAVQGAQESKIHRSRAWRGEESPPVGRAWSAHLSLPMCTTTKSTRLPEMLTVALRAGASSPGGISGMPVSKTTDATREARTTSKLSPRDHVSAPVTLDHFTDPQFSFLTSAQLSRATC